MNDLPPELLEMEQLLRGYKPAPLTPDFLERADLELFGASLAQIQPRQISPEILDQVETELLERDLHQLKPRALDKAFLDQLEAIPEAANLSKLQPKALSNDLLDRLSEKLENVNTEEEGAEENVISFPTVEHKPAKKNWKWAASAAVAACVGIFCGLAYTGNNPAADNITTTPTNSGEVEKKTDFISPANLQKVGIIDVEDKGLAPPQGNGQPQFRMMKVIEMQTFSTIDENGHKIQVQRPVEKTILVPVQPD